MWAFILPNQWQSLCNSFWFGQCRLRLWWGEGEGHSRQPSEGQSSWFLEGKRRKDSKEILALKEKAVAPGQFCLLEQTYSMFIHYTLRMWTTQPSAPLSPKWQTTGFISLWEILVKQWKSLHFTSLSCIPLYFANRYYWRLFRDWRQSSSFI